MCWLDRSCYLQQVEPQIQRSKKPAGAATLLLKQRASVPSRSEARVKDSLTLENSRQKKLKEIAKDAGNTATKTAKRIAATSTLGQCRRDPQGKPRQPPAPAATSVKTMGGKEKKQENKLASVAPPRQSREPPHREETQQETSND